MNLTAETTMTEVWTHHEASLRKRLVEESTISIFKSWFFEGAITIAKIAVHVERSTLDMEYKSKLGLCLVDELQTTINRMNQEKKERENAATKKP